MWVIFTEIENFPNHPPIGSEIITTEDANPITTEGFIELITEPTP